MNRIVFLLTCLFCFSLLCRGQAEDSIYYQELIAKANQAHLQKNYKLAIGLFNEALAIQTPDALTAYKMAGVYALDNNEEKATAFLLTAIEKGWQEADWLTVDPYFALLRQKDPENWAAILQTARKREQQYERTLKKPTLRREINQLVIQDQQLRYKHIQAGNDQDRHQFWQAIQKADSANLQAVKRIIKENGWPKLSDIGKDGANNLWLIVQHADMDILFQKHCLQLMEKLRGTEEINLDNYAYLYDRVQCNLNYKQYFGTQPIWHQNGTASGFRAIIEENQVNNRRKKVGLPSMQVYALTMGFTYQEISGQQATANDSLDVVYCQTLLDSAKHAYAKKDFPRTAEYYILASMVLSGMSDEENYEAALLFADIAKKTNKQKYKDLSLDFLNLLYLRGYLTQSMVSREPVLAEQAQKQRVKDSLQIKSYELGDVVITAGRTPIEAQQAARIVSVITKSDIERSPAQNLNDLLRYVGGVDIRQRGPFGIQADISIRGGTYDQTLILLNGVNITDPQTGHHNLNLPIDLESIERIEILQGPAAKSFGPNAFNGAINIITGNSKPNHIRSSGLFGQYGLNKLSANISNTYGNLGHFISISRMSSDGYIKNTDFSIANIFYQAKYKHKAGTIDFQTGYNKKDFGANSFYSLKYPNQFEATNTEFVSLKYQTNTTIKFAPTFYLRRNRDLFELKRNNDSVPFNHHRTTTTGLNLNVWTTHPLGKTSLGIDFRNEHIISNVLGNMLNKPVEVPNFKNAFYTKYYTRWNTSIYAEHTFFWKMLTATTGVMAHHNSDLKELGIYPGIDISYRFNNYFRLYSSVNKTLRMPTFTDMFYESPVQQSDPGLKPEEAVTIEGGIKYNNSFLKGNISAFRRWGYNMIDWVKNPSADSIIWRSMNHTQINLTGMECSLSLTPSQTGSFERIQAVRMSYSFIQSDKNSNSMLSKYAYDYLTHQITTSIDLRIAWNLYSSSRLTYHDRNGAYQDSNEQIVFYKPFWLADLKIYWKENHYILYTEASNIFNTLYYDFGGIIQPGVWFRGGIVVDLDYKK